MRKILMVDDDKDDRFIFFETLKKIDPDIIFESSKSGAEAFQRLSTEKILPDVIFLDINMPEMSGWEFLKKIKKQKKLKTIPVIMYSTSSHQRDVLIADDLGAIGFCTKPEDVTELAAIQKFITKNTGPLSKEVIRTSGLAAFKQVQLR